MKKKLLVVSIALCLLLTISVPSYGASIIKDLVTYNISVSVDSSSHGTVYWDYGPLGEFFCSYGPDGGYNPNCYISSGRTYTWSKAITRLFVPMPADGYTFSGFYDTSGRKYSLKSYVMDIVKLTSKGIIYYDCVKAKENSQFANYTNQKYKDTIKAGLKAIYGVSRYSVVGTMTMYTVPKKNVDLVARFSPKAAQILKGKEKYEKTYGDLEFVLKVANTVDNTFTFKSRNPSVATVDKYNGLTKLKGEGKAEIVVTAPATSDYEKATLSIFVISKPPKVNLESVASKKSSDKSKTGSLSLTWSRDSKCSGYEIDISKSSGFKSGVLTKTANSSKTLSKTIKSLDKGSKYFVRIRAYKKSCGEKFYGAWSNVLSSTVK